MGGRLPTLVPLDFDLERIAERARRRDLFAAAALTGMLADGKPSHLPNNLAHDAVGLADAMLAALDAAAGVANVSVPPAPVSRPPETRQTQRGGA